MKFTQRMGRYSSLGTALLIFSLSACLGAQPSSSQEDDADVGQAFTTFQQVFRFVQENYVDEVSTEVLLEGALDGLFESLGDRYSEYLDSDEMRSMSDTTQGEFSGVGMYISKQVVDEGQQAFVEIVAPIEDTPAFRAGILAGDILTAIEGESTADMDIETVVGKLRGPSNTDVRITIRRGGAAGFDVVLTRSPIEIPTVKYDFIESQGESYGYLRISQFTPQTNSRTIEALTQFRLEEVSAIIIDLRFNPGGLLSGVVDVADLFFDDGLIVGTSGRRDGENKVFNARRGMLVNESMPIVVLIDEGSASASEILSGALKDRGRAVVIGETSYGKGSVQQILNLGTSGFKLTMSKYYTPSGQYIDKIGVEPVEMVTEPELTDEEFDDYVEIRDQNLVSEYVDSLPDLDEPDYDGFLSLISDRGLSVPDRVARRLVTREVELRTNKVAVFDLDYDVVLQRAVEILQQGEYQELLEEQNRQVEQSSQGQR